jgi:hypothetical protein
VAVSYITAKIEDSQVPRSDLRKPVKDSVVTWAKTFRKVQAFLNVVGVVVASICATPRSGPTLFEEPEDAPGAAQQIQHICTGPGFSDPSRRVKLNCIPHSMVP